MLKSILDSGSFSQKKWLIMLKNVGMFKFKYHQDGLKYPAALIDLLMISHIIRKVQVSNSMLPGSLKNLDPSNKPLLYFIGKLLANNSKKMHKKLLLSSKMPMKKKKQH